MRFSILVLTAFILGGCAGQPMYKWGGYETNLYTAYKDTSKMEELMIGLEQHVSEMDKSGQKIAPGLFAELGTLYLQSGDSDKAISMYVRERDAWPESKALMDTMIKNLERRGQASKEIAK